MRRKYLLGATEDNEIVFGEFGITTRNGYPEFTASFNTVRPFNATDFDLVDYYEDWIEGMDRDYLYDMCVDFDCPPSELAENLADECYDVRDALDCSLYPEMYDVDGDDWCFESSGCGQHDTRNWMEEIINPTAYNLIHELWDNHHLNQVDESVVNQVEKLYVMLDEIDEEEWIVDYIKRTMIQYAAIIENGGNHLPFSFLSDNSISRRFYRCQFYLAPVFLL